MLNHKQIELSHMLFQKLKEKYPEIMLDRIDKSPENQDEIWVYITKPNNEDRQIGLYDMSGEISTDILLDYGYSILTASAT
jgi:hypothetical protein